MTSVRSAASSSASEVIAGISRRDSASTSSRCVRIAVPSVAFDSAAAYAGVRPPGSRRMKNHGSADPSWLTRQTSSTSGPYAPPRASVYATRRNASASTISSHRAPVCFSADAFIGRPCRVPAYGHARYSISPSRSSAGGIRPSRSGRSSSASRWCCSSTMRSTSHGSGSAGTPPDDTAAAARHCRQATSSASYRSKSACVSPP
jgi:hypothetical protein